MNTIAEHRGVSVDEARSKAAFVPRLIGIRPWSRLLESAAVGMILFLSPTLRAEPAMEVKVTNLMTKDLVNIPGKEVAMITVDYPPEALTPCTATTPAHSYTSWRGRSKCR
jgi:hypothetical protein